jgi:nucleoid DNA-binding protein
MNIAQSIRALLDKEGKVVVPGLGIFEIKHFPARLNKEKKKISAPQTHLFFIQKLNAEDDMLANYLAETEKVSPEESAKAVETYVNSLKDKLKIANKVKIERLGHLIIRDKHLYFRPDVVNELPELQAEPVRKEPVADKTVKEKKVKEKKEKKAPAFASFLAMPLILLFIMILILLYLMINPFNTPLFQTRYSGHYPFSKYPVREIIITKSQPAAVEETVTSKPSEQGAPEQQTAQIQEEPEQQTEQIQEEPVEAEPAITLPPKTGKYHIIVASLEYRTMAEVYAEKLISNGYPEATVIGPASNGNYRVSMDNFNEKSQALLHLTYARKLIDPNAWLLRY